MMEPVLAAEALATVCRRMSDQGVLFDAYKAASLFNGATFGCIAWALIRDPPSALRSLFLSRWPFGLFLVIGSLSSTIRGLSNFIPFDYRLDILVIVAFIQIAVDIPAVYFTWKSTRPLV